MKRNMRYLLMGLLLSLCLLCTACGDTEGQISPQEDPTEGLGGGLSEDAVNDFSAFEGIWLGEADDDYDSMEFDAEGSWTLCRSGEVVDEGYLRYEPEWEAVYAYSSRDDSGSRIAIENGRLYSTAYGYFNSGEGMEYLWYQDGDGNPGDGGDGNYDSYDISSLAGIWYYNGDLASDRFAVIDENGGWSLYQRAPGAENAEVDSGWLEEQEESNTFYAESAVYDGVSYRLYVFETDVMLWDSEEDYYERME